jgi:hypothetical protein
MVFKVGLGMGWPLKSCWGGRNGSRRCARPQRRQPVIASGAYLGGALGCGQSHLCAAAALFGDQGSTSSSRRVTTASELPLALSRPLSTIVRLSRWTIGGSVFRDGAGGARLLSVTGDPC